MNIKLYWTIGSQPSRAIRCLLLAGKVPHEAINVDFFKGENRTPEMLKINPSGLIPFITVNDQSFFESAAILRYLAQKFPSLNSYYPADLEQRAIIDAGLDFSATTLRPMIRNQFAPLLGSKETNTELSEFGKLTMADAKSK